MRRRANAVPDGFAAPTRTSYRTSTAGDLCGSLDVVVLRADVQLLIEPSITPALSAVIERADFTAMTDHIVKLQQFDALVPVGLGTLWILAVEHLLHGRRRRKHGEELSTGDR